MSEEIMVNATETSLNPPNVEQSKQERKEQLVGIEKEFNSKDGLIDIVVGIIFMFWGVVGISIIKSYVFPSWMKMIGYILFLIILYLINSYQNCYIKKKYPDLTKKELTSMSASLDQLIVVPGFIGIMILIAILYNAEINIPSNLFDNMLMYLLFAVCGTTVLCFLAMKYRVSRMYLWFFIALFIPITMLIYPNDWTRLYLKGGGLGVVMIITGLIIHIRFMSKYRKEIV